MGMRPVTVADAATISAHRAATFSGLGLADSETAAQILRESEPWMERLIATGEYIGWVIEDGEGVVAGAGIELRERGPVPGCLRVGRLAHVVNVYTEPRGRRQGYARRLMLQALEWCRENGMDHVTLVPTPEARPLYQSLGFAQTGEMMALK